MVNSPPAWNGHINLQCFEISCVHTLKTPAKQVMTSLHASSPHSQQALACQRSPQTHNGRSQILVGFRPWTLVCLSMIPGQPESKPIVISPVQDLCVKRFTLGHLNADIIQYALIHFGIQVAKIQSVRHLLLILRHVLYETRVAQVLIAISGD